MREIVFKAVYGDEVREVEISLPMGGGGGYHIYIDRYHCGVIHFQMDEWRIYFVREDEFTTEDRMNLIDLAMEHAERRS